MNEFAHGGTDDDHRRFARGMEACAHRADGRVPAKRRHGRHVERVPQTPGADLRQATAPAQGARFDEAWDQARKGRGLSCTGVALVKELGNQDGRCRLADAGEWS